MLEGVFFVFLVGILELAIFLHTMKSMLHHYLCAYLNPKLQTSTMHLIFKWLCVFVLCLVFYFECRLNPHLFCVHMIILCSTL